MTFAIRGATVNFGDVVALDDVTVSIPEGSVVAVVGGDGAGKSTLLRALVREVALDAGTVDTPPKDQQGYMPAVSGSWASLTVKENLDFVGGIYGVHGDELVARGAPRCSNAPVSPTPATGWRRSFPVGCAESWGSAWRCCTRRRCSSSTSRALESTP